MAKCNQLTSLPFKKLTTERTSGLSEFHTIGTDTEKAREVAMRR